MSADRVEIGNAIIAGIVDGDGNVLEQMSEVVEHLRLAGFAIVPIEPTQDMLDSVTSSEGYEPWTDKIMRETYQTMLNAALTPADGK